MEISILMQVLAPVLPFLLKLGDKAAEKAAEKVGEDSWGKAKAIWSKLKPKVEAKAAAQEAIADVAKNPDDADLQAAMRVQLKKILESDAELATAIAEILKDTTGGSSGTQIQQSVTGQGNQTIGQVQGQAKVIGTIKGDVTM